MNADGRRSGVSSLVYSRARILLFGATLAGCTQPESDTGSWSGTFVTLSTSEGVTPCGGTVDFLDRFVPHVYRFWTGAAPPGDFNVEIQLRRESLNGNFGGAQTGGSTAWVANQQALLHELNHLIVGWEDGRSAPVFREGVAEVLGPADLLGVWGQVLDPPESFAFLAEGDFDVRFYSSAAMLMRSLVHNYGVERVRTAYQDADESASPEEIEAVFVAAFGDEIYDHFDAFVTEEQCSLQAWECSEAVVPVRSLPATAEAGTDCETSSVQGSQPTETEVWFPQDRFMVDLPEDTMVRIVTTDNAVVHKMSCLSTCENLPLGVLDSFARGSSDNTVFERLWPAGRHTITVEPLDKKTAFSARVEVAD